jgi:hypothetical protein
VIDDHRVIAAASIPRQARRSTVVETTIDLKSWFGKQVQGARPDLLREMMLVSGLLVWVGLSSTTIIISVTIGPALAERSTARTSREVGNA